MSGPLVEQGSRPVNLRGWCDSSEVLIRVPSQSIGDMNWKAGCGRAARPFWLVGWGDGQKPFSIHIAGEDCARPATKPLPFRRLDSTARHCMNAR